MPKFELEKIAFINPSDLTEVVVASTILEGSDGATRSFVEDSAEGYVTEDNQLIEDDLTYALTILGKKTNDTDQAQLYTWANNGTKLHAVGYAYGKALMVDNIVLRPRAKGRDRLTWMLQGQKSGAPGYNSDGKLDTEFMMSKNLLNMYYWQFDFGTDTPAGWSKTGGTGTFDLINDSYELSVVGGASFHKVQREVYFPFPGVELTFFADILSKTGVVVQGLRFLDETGSYVDQNSGSAEVGIDTVSGIVPDGAVYFEVGFSVDPDEAVEFKNPGVSIGTSTEYISQ